MDKVERGVPWPHTGEGATRGKIGHEATLHAAYREPVLQWSHVLLPWPWRATLAMVTCFVTLLSLIHI